MSLWYLLVKLKNEEKPNRTCKDTTKTKKKFGVLQFKLKVKEIWNPALWLKREDRTQKRLGLKLGIDAKNKPVKVNITHCTSSL